MVDHLISDAMADAFDISIRREPVDIAALVSEVADANQPLAVNKQQTISVSAPPNIVTMCDAGALEGRHFALAVRSARFDGVGRVARHRLVYDALASLMPRGIHALAIDARATDEP